MVIVHIIYPVSIPFPGEILSLCDSYCAARREFYFDRSPRIFENILGLYRKVMVVVVVVTTMMMMMMMMPRASCT